ncbi:MAG: RNA polymerase sigma factor [Planctomycetota bacterium]
MVELDSVLVGGIKTGDEVALKQWLDLYLDRLYAFIYHRVDKNQTDAEDILQETMLAAFEGLTNFKESSSLFTWMCGIAQNKISGFLKKKHKIISLEAVMEKIQPRLKSLIEAIEERTIQPDETNDDEVKDIVNIVLSSLPPHYQKGLVAKYVNSLSVEEIARDWNMNLKAVESLLTRAREAFKQAFLLVSRERIKVYE